MVVLPRELGDVALQMLRADLVERAVMRPFQHGPEGLDSLGVRLAPDCPPSAPMRQIAGIE